jgi:hypothetical protein
MPIDPKLVGPWVTRAFAFGVGLLGLAYVLPGHFVPWDAFNQQWLAAMGGGLMAVAALGSSGQTDRGWPWFVWVLFLLAVTAPIQLALGQIHYRVDALMPVLYLCGMGLMVSAGRDLAGGAGQAADGRVDAVFRMLWMAAMVSTAIALAQWLGLMRSGVLVSSLPPAGRPFGNLAQVNHHATLLVLGMVGLVHEFERRRLSGPVVALAAGWLTFGLAMAQTRTSWLALALLVAWWFYWRARVGLRLPRVAVASLLLALVLGTLAFEPVSRLLLLAEPPNIAARLDAGPRSEMWLGMARAVWMQPWSGWGWNQVAIAHAHVATDHAAGHRLIQSAHSVLLDLPLAVGVPVALTVLGLFAVWLRARCLACVTGTQWALLAALMALCAHALVEYPLEYSYFLIPFGLFAGLLEGLQSVVPGPRPPRAVHPAALSLVFAMTIWLGIEYMNIEAHSRTVRLSLLGVGTTKAAYAGMPKPQLLDALADELKFMMTPGRPNMTSTELADMKAISQRFPTPPAMLRYALAAGLNGQSEDAVVTLRRLCHMHLHDRCAEARTAWREAQAQHPELKGIPAP